MLQRIFFLLLIRPFITLFIGLRVLGREHLPARGPFLIVSNHASHLDTLAILSLFPGHRRSRIRPVAAADYWTRNRLFAWFSSSFLNVLAIERRPGPKTDDPMQLMLDALKSGDSLLLFPEGTRGEGEEMAPFKSGAARLVEAMPELTVVPVCLVNLGRSMPKGAWVPLPLFCEVRVGEPLRPSGDRGSILVELEAAVTGLRDEGP